MTRMWMTPPHLMCRQHLLGEHKEIHQLVGTILAGYSVDGYVEGGLIETGRIRSRHAELVREMLRRGYNHRSPLRDFPRQRRGAVDVDGNLRELRRRCSECKRIQRRGGVQ